MVVSIRDLDLTMVEASGQRKLLAFELLIGLKMT